MFYLSTLKTKTVHLVRVTVEILVTMGILDSASNLQSYFVNIISVFEPLFELEGLLSLLVSAQNDKDYDKNHLMYACMR